MIKQLFILIFFICSLQSFSQKLVYKSNGNILNSENQKISPDQVRELLKDNQQLLADYNAGRTKKTVGNIMLYGGLGIITGYTGYNLFIGEYKFSSPANIIGLASVVASVPIKIGFSKKIEKVVTDYNNLQTTGYNNPKLDLITNSNGIGLRLTLN